jgi:hypothetical protein
VVLIAQVRSELLKQRSIRTNVALFAAMLGLVLLAVLLHALGLPASSLANRSDQLRVFEPGEKLGTLFAALFGAISVTGEFRHGTIRPTFPATPQRGRVVAAKVWASMLVGPAFGVAACGLVVVAGAVALRARGIDVHLTGADDAQLVAGGAAAGALWAAIGVGLGTLIRNQVPALIGICAWLLFVEGLLIGDVASVTAVGRYAPGAAAAAITGQDASDSLLAPAVGLVVLVAYAAVTAGVGWLATTRRDVI